MKKIYISFGCLIIMMLIASFTGCGTSPKQSSTGEYIDDAVITTKVKTQLAADDFLKSFRISVETYKGTVQLSGFVDSQQAVNRAGEIARDVKGVTAVKNDLVVR